jgi:hypothetical protein
MVVEAQFDTDNGAFVEIGETNLDEPPVAGYADIFLSRTPDELQGSYRPDSQGVNVEIAATLRGDSVNGVIALRGAPLGDSQYLVIGRYQGVAVAGAS